MESERIENEEQLELELSRPHPGTVEQLRSIGGDFLVLGAGGKMGPTLCRLLKNACAAGGGRRRIYAVSRFSDTQVRDRLNYANEPRYGVLVDLAQKVLAGRAIDLAMGYVNVIWQADANNYIARSLSLASSLDSMLSLIVDWVQRGEKTLKKPTKYQVRDGKF